MLNIPFFSYIPQQTIDQLINVSQETMMERDAPITRVNKLMIDKSLLNYIQQGEKATNIYIITRGGGLQ